MKGFCELQVKMIKRCAKKWHMDEEDAVDHWIECGLAEKFGRYYRPKFGIK